LSRRREEHSGGHGNSERWLLTYADVITLLLGLFILLYSISNVDAVKWKELSTQFGEYFNPAELTLGGGSGNGSGDGTGDGSGGDGTSGEHAGISGTKSTPPPGFIYFPVQPGEGIDLDELQIKISELIEKNNLNAYASVHAEDRGVVVSLVEGMLFPSGSAEINDDAYEILYQLIDIIQSVQNYIRVEGSTDDIPIHSARYYDNWALAADRAANVARVMKETGVDPKRITVISYGEYRPVAPNDSEANRQLNRRVDVVFLNSELDIYEPGNTDEPTPTPTPTP
jgi:chemotaxis protein MotB